MTTRNSKFVISHQNGGLTAIYEADRLWTSALLGKDFARQGWLYTLSTLQEVAGNFVLSINIRELIEVVEFKQLNFDGPMDVVGQTTEQSISMSV
jgi:hypothetical protein